MRHSISSTPPVGARQPGSGRRAPTACSRYARQVKYLHLALILLLGCSALKPRGDASVDAPANVSTGSSATSSAALCAYLARCVPKALNAFSKGSVENCINYYDCGAQGLAALSPAPLLDEAACAAEIDATDAAAPDT
jgi:hypothetical protein